MLILSRYKDTFGEKLFERMKTYREGVEYHPFAYRIFSDGEPSIRFPDEPRYSIKRGEIAFPHESEKVRKLVKEHGNVVFLNRGASGRNWHPTNEIFNILKSSKYLKDTEYGLCAEKVCVIMPNMAFAKQDKFFYEDGNLIDGDEITVDFVRKLISQHTDLLINITPHDFRKTGWIVKDENLHEGWSKNDKGNILDENRRIVIPKAIDLTNFAYAIDATPLLVEKVFSGLKRPYVIGGDASVNSAISDAKNIYNGLGGTSAEKTRDRHTSVTSTSLEGIPDNMKKFDAVLLDDVIITAGTMAGALDEVKKRNPRSLTCAAVHGEFSYNKKNESGLNVLQDRGARVIVTNTMETPVSEVDVTDLLAEKLYELYK